MPGTIQVSVLEFMAPQSSSSFSQMSIKISMGKIEYQTWDKGDFYFPLTTLRNNLIIILQDAHGKEISHTVVETRLVIEKEIWDDLFPFEGGGHVHMKLQFVLNEEDRHRIQIMRESALRKKNEELNIELGSPTHATTVSSIVASPLRLNHEISDSNKSLIQSEVIQAGMSSTVPSILFTEGMSGPKYDEGTHSVEKQTNPVKDYNAVFDIHPQEVSRRILVQEFSSASIRTIHSEEASCLGSSGSVFAAKNQAPANLKADEANNPEKQSPPNKTPSKIRNMISAFETNLHQDMRPKIRSSATITSQSSKTRMDVSSKATHHTGDVQQASSHIRKREDIGFVRALAGSTSSWETGQLEELRAGQVQAKGKIIGSKDEVNVMHKVDMKEERISSEKLARASTGEKTYVSGRMLMEKGTHLLSNMFAGRRNFGGNPLRQKNGKGTQSKCLRDVKIQENSGDETHSAKSYGAWIFPDGGKRLCITAGGKQIMDLVGSCHAEAKGHLGKMSYPIAESEREAKGGDRTSQSQSHKESITEDSTDAETPRGPIGQVMRVMIMVGFATLVFFTRQTKPGHK